MSASPSGSDLGEVNVACVVNDASQVAEARRLATALAADFAFNETQTGNIAIVVTEAATNLLKHAGRGQILLRGSGDGTASQLDIVAVDQGPGMRDLERCLRDGFSTTGSPGTGLGAIRRLSGAFDLFSSTGGSALLSRNWNSAFPFDSEWGVGAVCIAKSGEPVCGDGWAVERMDDHLLLLMVDGLGHGLVAATASAEAARIFRANAGLEPAAIMQRIHEGLRSTRGAAVAICRITVKTRELRYVGLGNISTAIVADGQSRSMVSHNGTAGVEARKIQEFTYSVPPRALVVVHSDGIGTHWRLADFPGLAQRDPSLVAGVLFQKYQRGRDDATVVVMSESCVRPS